MWNQVLRIIGRIVMGTLRFFGRLVRDVWFQIWIPIRRGIVRLIPWLIGAGILVLAISHDTQGILATIVAAGLILFAIIPKKKRRGRR